MHVDLSETFKNYIRQKVETGLYGNSTEVIRDALRRMMEQDERPDSQAEKIAAFERAIEIGYRQVQEGKVVPYNDELRSRIKKQAMKMYKKGIVPKSDATP